jgi:Fe2+ or Zn2+ uptake regulation protein
MDKSPLSEQWLAALQARGYRLTEPLRAIVGILADSRRALGPVELYDLGRRDCPSMGLVTVYRSLEKLENLGLVQRVHQVDGCHMYLRTAQGHKHILLCTRCGRVEYFSGDDLSALIEATARESGFDIQEHWLQFHGRCAECQKISPAV